MRLIYKAGIRVAGLFVIVAMLGAIGRQPTVASTPDNPEPVPAEQAAATLTVAPGLEATLFACEPVVRQPLSLSFDDRGRLWVLQYLQYPIPEGLQAVQVDQYLRTKYDKLPLPPPHGPRGQDRISILTDTDGDWRIDKATDFLGGLNLASGMALGHDGVFVVQPPYLLYYADLNHDDAPDGDPEVLLTGFGMEDAHAFANSLTWGPDGWLYGAQGSTVTANIRGIEFQQGIWRYHPLTRQFELFAEGGGNTWGIDFDRQGNLFAGGNTTEPLCHHVQGAYYVKGFGKHGPLHNPYTFGYFNPVVHQGFLGSGLTGGFVIYQGGVFPERFNGACIYPNTRQNAVRSARLVADGSTWQTHFEEDVIVASDRWFRPVESLVGPDGALYVADWYDVNISHTNPKDRSQWYPPHRENGRIWRIAPPDAPRATNGPLPLATKTSYELIGLLNHPNAWSSREARRILAERRDQSTFAELVALVDRGDERIAQESLWTLYASGGLTADLATRWLAHPQESLRTWCVRALGELPSLPPMSAAALANLVASEPSVRVRSQLASTAKRLPTADCLAICDALLSRDTDIADPHLPLLIWWAIESKAASDPEAVLSLVAEPIKWARPMVEPFLIERLARRFAATGAHDDFASCARLAALAPSALARAAVLSAIETQLAGSVVAEPPPVLVSLVESQLQQEFSPAAVRLGLRMGLPTAIDAARRVVCDAAAVEADRLALIRAAGEVRRSDLLPNLLDVVASPNPVSILGEAAGALARYDSPVIADAFVSIYEQSPVDLRARLRDILVSRLAWSARFVDAVEAGKIAPAETSLEQARQIWAHADQSLNERVTKIWGRLTPATTREKQGRIMAVTQILGQADGDTARGKPLFAKHCGTCHQLHGEGTKIGPDLTSADRKNLDVLLRNVVDPSAQIRQEFQSFTAHTEDGRVLVGLLAENTVERITLLDAKNNRTILARAEIAELAPSELSLMPEGNLDQLTNEELRDLFAYLRSDAR